MRVLAGRCCTGLAGLPAVAGGGPYITIRARLETARQRIPAAMGRDVPRGPARIARRLANAGRVPLTDTRPGMIDISSRRLLYEPALPALT